MKTKKEINNQKSNTKKMLKYGNIAIDMMIKLSLFTLIGFRLDKKINCKFPIFTSIFSIGSIILFTYQLIKKLTKNK